MKRSSFPAPGPPSAERCSSATPKKSAHLVQQILDDFKSGKKDFFEFWINPGPRKAYIRYFAVRDEAGRYLGCVGVDQDITEIQKLQGEKRF
ncbi:MAG: PAS domain-containing protein [Bacillota bacterium]